MFGASPYTLTTSTGAAEGRRDSQKPLWEPHPEVLWLFPTCLDSRPGSWDLFKGTSFGPCLSLLTQMFLHVCP